MGFFEDLAGNFKNLWDDKYVNVNEKAGLPKDLNAKNSDWFTSILQGGESGIPGFQEAFGKAGANFNALQSTDPQAALNAFLTGGSAGQGYGLDIQNLVNQLTGNFQSDARSQAESLAQDAISQISGRYAGSGLGRSGAGLAAITKGALAPKEEALTKISELQAGMGSNLANQFLQSLVTGEQNRLTGLQAAGAGQSNIGSQLLSALAGQSQQALVAPMVEKQAGLGSSLQDILTTILSSGAGSLAEGGMNALTGGLSGLGGGVSDLLKMLFPGQSSPGAGANYSRAGQDMSSFYSQPR